VAEALGWVREHGQHKFKIAELVELKQHRGVDAPRGPYEIVALFPEDGGVPVYRIKGWREDSRGGM
jgi:hypothetical protein